MNPDLTLACYYFPNYHPTDARNQKTHGTGWSEWELVQAARPRYPGHRQPRVPLWGYEDESDPQTMARKIDAAADHGLDAFIFDWYWFDDGPFLERGLEEGFLKAANNSRLKFCCMWANHNWKNIHPAKLVDPKTVLYPGKILPSTFTTATHHVIDRYFKHPSHLMVGGCPYFSIYELGLCLPVSGASRRRGPRSMISAPAPRRPGSPICISTPSSGAALSCRASPRPPIRPTWSAISVSTA